MFQVNEIFPSIQGEGPAMGEPCTFIRFSGCNLDCPGCDTNHETYSEMDQDAIMEVVERLDYDLVVLTGGEPFLQEGLASLITELYERGFMIDVETNGTVHVRPGVLRMLRYVVCSPKRGQETLLNLKGKYIKLVVAADGPGWTWPPYVLKSLLRDPMIVGESTVYLMPYGTDSSNAELTWDLAVRYHVRYSDRLQWRLNRK